MKALLIALLAWIDQSSVYDTRDMPLPDVIEVDAAQLTQRAYRDTPQHMPDDGVDERLFAWYTWQQGEHGTIYIRPAAQTHGPEYVEAPLDNPVFQERLLHELIHHVQYLDSAYDRFHCVKQAEAYKLGGAFLHQKNVVDPLPNRQQIAYFMGFC
jgi:hypothetical protein